MTATVMIVDDLDDNRKLLKLILEDNYRLCEARTGLECLSGIEEQKPDLILLDVNMPGISGYEVCRKLKETPETAMTPVIFVSAMGLPEHRLEGYEAGCDEYIVKPINPDVVLSKVEAALATQEYYKTLQRQASDAMGAALEAMTASSEMGLVIQFMKESGQCTNLVDLHQTVSNTLMQFGLSGCCRIYDEMQTHFFGCSSQSLEARVMTKCCALHRIYDFGIRSVFSENHISVLVKNMPHDEVNRLGRVKDNLAILINIAEMRLRSILMEMELVGRRKSIVNSLIQVTEQKLENINACILQHEKNVSGILQNLINRLDDRLVFLGLDEDQELALRKLAADSMDDIVQLGSFSEDLTATLSDVLEGLYRLLENN